MEASSERTKFCQYLAETSVCFGSCACAAVDSCDGNTKAVAPKANQTQQDLFDEVCNAWNNNNCIDEKGEFQCGKDQFSAASAAPVSTAPFFYLLTAVIATHLAVNK